MAEQHSTRRKAGCSGGQSPYFRNQLVLQLRDGLAGHPTGMSACAPGGRARRTCSLPAPQLLGAPLEIQERI